jgi:preprotein translocase subunit Sss1
MAEDQNKIHVEKAFWRSWGKVEKSLAKNRALLETDEPARNDKEYVARLARLEADATRKENIKLLVMIVVGILAIGLTVYLLSLINIKPEATTASSGGNSQQSASQPAESPESIEASIQEEMSKGGFSSKEAYFSSELIKQTNEVDSNLTVFSKKIKLVTPKMNITSLVIASKLDQLSKDKIMRGFGIEVVGARGAESDDVKLISHLKGMTSSVEFFAEGGRVVAHFKDYPPSYCAGTKGAAVCGD